MVNLLYNLSYVAVSSIAVLSLHTSANIALESKLYNIIVYWFPFYDTIRNRLVSSVNIVQFVLWINFLFATKWTPTCCWRLWCNFPCLDSSGTIISTVFLLATGTFVLLMSCHCPRWCPATVSSLFSGGKFDTNTNVNPVYLVKNPSLISLTIFFFIE